MSTVAPAESRVELEDFVEETRRRVATGLRGRDRLITGVSGAAFLVTAVLLAVLADTSRSVSFGAAAVLIVCYALASRVEFEIGTGSAIPTQLIFVPMMFLFPAKILPLAVALGLIVGLVPDIRLRRFRPDRAFVQLASSWHALGPALVMLLGHEPKPSLELETCALLAAAIGAQFAFDLAGAGLRGHFALAVSVRDLLAFLALVYLVDLALVPLGLAVAIVSAGRPLAPLLGMPLVGLLAFFARERRRRIDHALELSNAYRGTAFLLGDVVDADDAYTGMHSHSVVELVVAVTDELSLGPRERRNAEFAALLHDVGKIRIPNEIINKPGELTPEERALIETHTIEGERLLERVGGLLGDVGHIVRSCHERWDGRGYPDRLAGEDIPLIARIVMCCDAFNAMTSDRSYRRALPYEEAVEELRRNSGSQFDPAIVEALLRRLPLAAADPPLRLRAGRSGT
jgi:HD-GYP domain-containing protein (c-di-GMP phosphodiesterase class II)